MDKGVDILTPEELAEMARAVNAAQTTLDISRYRNAGDALESLREAVRVRSAAEEGLEAAVRRARGARLSWDQIATVLGVREDSARQRWGYRIRSGPRP